MSQVVTAFKFDNQTKAPNSIQQFEEVKAYIVSYVDGEGKEQVRLCFRPITGAGTFVLQERINGSFVATTASKWFHTALSGMLEKTSAGPVESI